MHTVKRTEGFCRERRAYMHQAQLVDPNECVLVTGVGVSPREAMMSLLKHTERMQADQLAALNEALRRAHAMRRDVELGVRVFASAGERQGELVHGTGYHDHTGHWKNGSRWVRRYPDAKVHNGMSRYALRARDAFHVLRSMPSDGYSFDLDDVRTQAVLVVIHTLNWLNA